MSHESDTPEGRRATRYSSGDRSDDRAEVPGVASARPRKRRRSPLLAVAILVAMAVIIALVGVAARDSGLAGSQATLGTFELLPISTTTS